jgi:hypothetical protein
VKQRRKFVEYNYQMKYFDEEGTEVKQLSKTVQAGSDFSAKGMARAEAMWLHGFEGRRGGKVVVTRRARKDMSAFRAEVKVPAK